MNWGKIFAIANMSLSIAAAIGYAFVGDWRKVIYWFAAAALTASVTF